MWRLNTGKIMSIAAAQGKETMAARKDAKVNRHA
jgi:hypothetical protein